MTGASLHVDKVEHFIDGEWVRPAAGGSIEVVNPATEEPAGRVAAATPADIDRAVAAARRSFDQGDWRWATPAERADVIDRAADLLEARAEELVETLTAELGCPRWFSARAHVPNPIRHLRTNARIARELRWDEERDDGRFRSIVTQEPVGVCAAITPWNGPLSSPALKIAPALATGCSIVCKPTPQAPLSMVAMAEAFDQAGLPAGVFNLTAGGREAGARLVGHPDVDKVGFTGSSAAGRAIMAACAQRIARVTLEMGGKSAAVVLDDADPQDVAEKLPPMSLMVNGQLCIAQSRVLVPRSRADEFTAALAESIGSTPVGDPMDPETVVGPLVSDPHRDHVEGYLRIALAEGARAVVGGGRPADLSRGYFLEPTLLDRVDNGMRIAREEVFGPVMAVIVYDDEEDAIRIADDSIYGLSGSVWSGDPEHGLAVARRIRTGMVSVNGFPQAWGTPFGGFKQSGIGREMGPEGLREYVEPKSIAVGPVS